MREKTHWERRIVELGGPDYSKTGPKVTDSQGRAVADTAGRGTGYRYFGAAKNLPGVKELFEKEAPRQVRPVSGRAGRAQDVSRGWGSACVWAGEQSPAPGGGPWPMQAGAALRRCHPRRPPTPRTQTRRTRAEMYKLINGDYYGFRDEEDGVLVKVEAEAEAVLRAEVGLPVAAGRGGRSDRLRLCARDPAPLRHRPRGSGCRLNGAL